MGAEFSLRECVLSTTNIVTGLGSGLDKVTAIDLHFLPPLARVIQPDSSVNDLKDTQVAAASSLRYCVAKRASAHARPLMTTMEA